MLSKSTGGGPEASSSEARASVTSSMVASPTIGATTA